MNQENKSSSPSEASAFKDFVNGLDLRDIETADDERAKKQKVNFHRSHALALHIAQNLEKFPRMDQIHELRLIINNVFFKNKDFNFNDLVDLVAKRATFEDSLEYEYLGEAYETLIAHSLTSEIFNQLVMIRFINICRQELADTGVSLAELVKAYIENGFLSVDPDFQDERVQIFIEKVIFGEYSENFRFSLVGAYLKKEVEKMLSTNHHFFDEFLRAALIYYDRDNEVLQSKALLEEGTFPFPEVAAYLLANRRRQSWLLSCLDQISEGK